MKKIILETRGREINIASLEEVETIHDVLNELVIPALQASGFNVNVIADGLHGWLEEFDPEYFKTDEPEQTHTPVVEDNREPIKLGSRIKHDWKDCNGCENCTVGGEEEEEPEIVRCNDCHREFPEHEIEDGICEECYQDSICPECGGFTDNSGDVCSACIEQEQAEEESVCHSCGEHVDYCSCEDEEPHPIQRPNAPEPQVWSTENPMGHYSGWSTSPNEAPAMEPEQKDIPTPNGVGVWSVKELNEPDENKACNMTKGLWKVEQADKEEQEEPNEDFCEYCGEELENDGTCPDCDRISYELTQEQKDKNFQESTMKLAEVQKQFDEGEWKHKDYDNTKDVNCDNIHKHFPDVDCDDCSKCPIGSHTHKATMEHGLFFCSRCDCIWKDPFPLGCCPECGIHAGTGCRRGREEFCGEHWDINRANDNYEAHEEENFSDEDDTFYED